MELAARVRRMLELDRAAAAAAAVLGRPPTDDEWAAAAGLAVDALSSAVASGRTAKDLLVSANLRLVVSIAKRYLNNGMSLQVNGGHLCHFKGAA